MGKYADLIKRHPSLVLYWPGDDTEPGGTTPVIRGDLGRKDATDMPTEMTDETRMPSPKTSPEQRADLRDALERVGRGELWWEPGRDNVSILLAAAPALLADADALAGARAECERLRAVLETIRDALEAGAK